MSMFTVRYMEVARSAAKLSTTIGTDYWNEVFSLLPGGPTEGRMFFAKAFDLPRPRRVLGDVAFACSARPPLLEGREKNVKTPIQSHLLKPWRQRCLERAALLLC